MVLMKRRRQSPSSTRANRIKSKQLPLPLPVPLPLTVEFHIPSQPELVSLQAKNAHEAKSTYAIPHAKDKAKAEADHPSQTPLLQSAQHPSSAREFKSSTTMLSKYNPSDGGDPLSLLVLLPASAHMHTHHDAVPPLPPARPSPLVTRKSGSMVMSLRSLATSKKINSEEKQGQSQLAPGNIGSNSGVGVSGVGGGLPDPLTVNTGRRLSLAPGMGGGTETRSPDVAQGSTFPPQLADIPSSSSSPQDESTHSTHSTSGTASPLSANSSEAPPAFGAKRPSGSPRSSRRRPNTAASPAISNGPSFARASMALPSGLGMGGSGRNRPGWEGDEVVGVLRSSGLEVTVIRNASHLPALLSPNSSSPTFQTIHSTSTVRSTATASASASDISPTALNRITPVILVPLCDSPTLPSLSLLLSKGTTPTAVCFQQDLLERAKQTEEEWLPAALDQIKTVVDMRDRAARERQKEKQNQTGSIHSEKGELPIILAYSANPALSPSTTGACVAAGAAGVLKPPFDAETARFLRRMVRAAKEGRISSIVELPSHQTDPAAPPSPIMSHAEFNVAKLILPETALTIGGEHASEKVLTAAVSTRNRRATSGQLSSSEVNDLTKSATSLTESSTNIIADSITSDPFSAYTSTGAQRRRSVDVGGLSLALKRAQRAFEATILAGLPPRGSFADIREGYLPSSVGMRKELSTQPRLMPVREAGGAEEKDTHLAELLSAMYYQTTVAIDIQMAEYNELSAPLSPSHRSRLVDALSTWNFKPHELDEGDLFRLAVLLFEAVLNIEGVAELGIKSDQMNRLLFAIRAIYHAPNPYHNYVHAIDVLQATYSFMLDIGIVPPYEYLLHDPADRPIWERPDEEARPVCGLGTRRAREVMRPQDVLGLLIAAMGHDVGHPGLSNAFMKNAKTPLSEVYDDKSVLENMHCMLVVQLLRKHGFDFLISPTPSASSSASTDLPFDHRGFRRVLYSSVLATDMSLHFAWIARLKEFGASLRNGSFAAERPGEGDKDEEDRIMICQALIKCADISNPTRPLDVSQYWSSVLLEEWAKQASLEQELDLPVSVIASADAALQAKGQIGFIDLFTQPLFEAVSDVLPELEKYADTCADNRSLWQARLEHFTAEAETDASKRLIVQPAVELASQDDRFRSLFPLLLPTSLVEAGALEPGPVSTAGSTHFDPAYSLGERPVTPTSGIQQVGSASGSTPRSGISRSQSAQDDTRPPSGMSILVPKGDLGPDHSRTNSAGGRIATSSTSHSGSITPAPSSGSGAASPAVDSPTAKAMRAVYHSSLVDQRHRVPSWTVPRGLPTESGDAMGMGTGLVERRASTPGEVASG